MSPEQPALLEGVSAHGTRVGTKWCEIPLPTQTHLIEVSEQLANQRLGNSYSPFEILGKESEQQQFPKAAVY